MGSAGVVYIATRTSMVELGEEKGILNWALAVVSAARAHGMRAEVPLITRRLAEIPTPSRITAVEVDKIASAAVVVILIDDLAPTPCIGLGYVWRVALARLRPIIPVCVGCAQVTPIASESNPPPAVAPLHPRSPKDLERALGPLFGRFANRTIPAIKLSDHQFQRRKLGSSLAGLRNSRGLGVSDLARRLGTTDDYVKALEDGQLDVSAAVYAGATAIIRALPATPSGRLTQVHEPSDPGVVVLDFLKRHSLSAGKYDRMIEQCARADSPLTERDLWSIYNVL